VATSVRRVEPGAVAAVPVQGDGMLIVACAGLPANLVSRWVLFGGHNENVNVEGASPHMLEDALGSVGAIVAGGAILLTGRLLIDPLVSFVIGGLILWSSLGLLRRTLRILINATPADIDFHAIKEAMADNEHVAEVHDLHIWSVTSGLPVLTAHVRLRADCCDTQHWQQCLREMQDMLRERFDIEHATLQFEPEGYEKDGRNI
jgi:cobalt-zinc-cadmium efflux system protein